MQREAALPTTDRSRAPSIPHITQCQLWRSRLFSLLAEFVNLAKSTCFSAGLMSSAGTVQHKWLRRKIRQRDKRKKQQDFSLPLTKYALILSHVTSISGLYRTDSAKISPTACNSSPFGYSGASARARLEMET